MKMLSSSFYNSLDPLKCWLSNGVLKRVFLESGLTKSLTVCNFRNKVAMTIIFFLKIFKIRCRFRKWQEKIKKKFLVLKIIAFESGRRNSLNLQKDTCHWQSMCHKTPLRFNISLREIFSKLGSLRVRKKSDESALIKILQEFRTI